MDTQLLKQILEAVQSLTNVLKKFEDFKITELPAAGGEPLPNELIAVITAAVDCVMAGPHRILSITPVGGKNINQPHLAWSSEGRRQIFQSHTLR